MRYIIKILGIFLFLFILIQNTYGESVDNHPIQDISYENYLTGSTEINIIGKLKKCDLTSISGKKVKYKKEENSIKFNFSEINSYNGIVTIECNGKKYLKDFFFPHITEYQTYLGNNLENIIEIQGENFGDKPLVYIGNEQLTIIQNDDRLIVAKLKDEIKTSSLYIKNKGNLKSNLINTDIVIPKIEYIKSDNGFRAGTTLEIHTKNFDFSSDNIVVLNNKKQQQVLAKNYKKNFFTFKLPNKYIGETSLYIIKNGIKSKTIKLNIFPDLIPIIKQITPGIDKDGKKILKIKGENFINNEDLKIKLGKNGDNLKILSINNNEIFVYEDNKIKNGNNYIYIEEAKKFSNIYNYFIEGNKKPFIGEITTEGLTPDKKFRIFRLTTNYFNKKTDGLTLNNNSVYNYGYYGNLIKIKIDKSKTKGYFGFTRNNKKIDYIKKFDFDYNYSPIIKSVRIKGDFIPGTKIEIEGKNFLSSKISANNLFGKNSNGSYDISISNSKIIGYLPKDFNINQSSSINIENNGKRTQLSFRFKELNKKNINGPFLLDKITNNSNDFIIKQGDTLNIFGSYHHTTDKIFLNDKKINFTFVNPTQIKIKLDDNIKPGIYEIKIKNNIGIETKLGDFFIFNKKINPKIKIYQELNKNTNIIINPITQDNKNSVKLNYNIKNQLAELQVNKVVFKVKNYNPELFLNVFDLELNGDTISTSSINKKGEIIFNSPFTISKKFNKTDKLTIIKDSPYIKSGKVNLVLEKIEGVFLTNNTEIDAKNNIEINNIDTNFEIIFDKNQIIKCLDKNSQLVSCEKIKINNSNDSKNTKNNIDKSNTTSKNNTEEIKKKNEGEELKYIKLLANSRHKLNKSLKGQKYIKLIDKITIKYSKNLEILLKLDKKIKTLQEKLKDKTGLKYQETKNIINYLDAKISLEIIKQTK